MKFKAKNDMGYLIVLLVLVMWLSLITRSDQSFDTLLFVTGILLLLELFLLQFILHSFVLLTDDSLLIVFGFLKQRIPYKDITSIRETKNPLSSMAFSLDRLGIENETCGYVMIAVKQKREFLDEMHRRSPAAHILRKGQ